MTMTPIIFVSLATLFATPVRAKPATNPRVSVHHFHSAALAERRSYTVYLPPAYDATAPRRYPVIYLLHGLGGKGANWFDPAWGALDKHLDRFVAEGAMDPVIAIAPDGGVGYWTNHLGRKSKRFGDYVAKDLVAEVDARFKTQRSREGRSVAGVSMGGHGAMSVVLMHPQTFSAAVSLAGALFLEAPTHRKVYGRVWGKPPNASHWRATSPIELMKRLDGVSRDLPALYIFCGTKDGLRFHDYARAASRILKKRAIPHELSLAPGGVHSWKTFGPEASKWLPWLQKIRASRRSTPARPAGPGRSGTGP